MRIVLIASAPPAALGYHRVLTGLGHDVPALFAYRGPEGRYGPGYPFALHGAAPDADLVLVRSNRHMAGLFRAYEPDLVCCASFPIKVPDEALAVPRLGVMNAHPALLPRYRGPNPFGWALRNGDGEIGFTLHRMTSDYDAGAIYAQGSVPLGDDEDLADEGIAKLQALVAELVPRALTRVEAGDPGDPQDESLASYAAPFEPEYIEVDWSQPARAIHDQTRAWKLATPTNGTRGPLTTLKGGRVRLLRTQLDDARGGERVETGDGPLWVVEGEPLADDG
ncbi:MAG TPA: formyltransferase family protein [Thermoleophilaceae bacterium]